MDTHAIPAGTPLQTHGRAGHRTAWHAIAVVAAAAVAWLVFTAYRQPDLILNLADLRLC
ncbi:MAG TPA: hypothetical protein VJV77_09735 [Casimicrobiaceae bacterium]|nr:hypothetical protein [Casimicrobiaceae bacterium]